MPGPSGGGSQEGRESLPTSSPERKKDTRSSDSKNMLLVVKGEPPAGVFTTTGSALPLPSGPRGQHRRIPPAECRGGLPANTELDAGNCDCPVNSDAH